MRILLVQTSFLGDTILSTPLIAALKKLYPESELWMMTTPASGNLVKRDPLLAGVIGFDKRGKQRGILGLRRMARELRAHRFDKAYSLHKSARTALLLRLAGIPERIGFTQSRMSFLYHKAVPRAVKEHDVLRNLSLLRPEAPQEGFEAELRLFAPLLDECGDEVRALLSRAPEPIVLVPGSAWKTKRWSWDNYRDVARYFIKAHEQVVILGAASEHEVCAKVAEGLPAVDLSGRTSLEEMMLVIKRAKLVICNDSMSLHVASAFKVPTVAIYCATSPSFGFTPWRNRAVVIEKKGLSCKPCSRHGTRTCPTGTEACMRELPPHEVISAALGLLNSNRPAEGLVE